MADGSAGKRPTIRFVARGVLPLSNVASAEGMGWKPMLHPAGDELRGRNVGAARGMSRHRNRFYLEPVPPRLAYFPTQ